MTTEWLITARALHFAACLMFFGMFAFDRFVRGTINGSTTIEVVRYWNARLRTITLAALIVALLSGAAWFSAVAIKMSALPPGQALTFGVLAKVWGQTRFGNVWQLRLVCWFLAVVTTGFFWHSKSATRWRRGLSWTQCFLGAVFLGSLAWAGHGVEGSPAHWHVLADVLHLVVAGIWPTGLLPLALLLRRIHRSSTPGKQLPTFHLVRRFSVSSLGAVALLAATGWVNSWFLVGSPVNLVHEPYGRWLLLKLVLFGGAVGIGAINLLRLKPRLLGEPETSAEAEAAAAQLQVNVLGELLLSGAIVIVVAIIGILPPALR